jgi:type VI protein secretion system component VasF
MYAVIITNFNGKYTMIVSAENERDAIQIALHDLAPLNSVTNIEAVVIKNYKEVKK